MGVYIYNTVVTFIGNTKGVLEEDYFKAATDGMKGLMDKIQNDLTKFKVNVAITKADV